MSDFKIYFGTASTSSYIHDCAADSCLAIYPRNGYYVGLGTCATPSDIGFGGTYVNELEALNRIYAPVFSARGDSNSFFNFSVADDLKGEVGGWRWLWIDEGATDNAYLFPNAAADNFYIFPLVDRVTWTVEGLSIPGDFSADDVEGDEAKFVNGIFTGTTTLVGNVTIVTEQQMKKYIYLVLIISITKWNRQEKERDLHVKTTQKNMLYL